MKVRIEELRVLALDVFEKLVEMFEIFFFISCGIVRLIN